jgi:hypothetical protein
VPFKYYDNRDDNSVMVCLFKDRVLFISVRSVRVLFNLILRFTFCDEWALGVGAKLLCGQSNVATKSSYSENMQNRICQMFDFNLCWSGINIFSIVLSENMLR